MPSWTSADVTLVAPELVTSPAIPGGTFDLFIAKAERQMNLAAFGAQVADAGALLTAHMMIRLGYGKNASGGAAAGSAVGAISSIAVGKVSVGFATSAATATAGGDQASELKTTRQGAMYLAIVESLVLAPFAIDSSDFTEL